MTVYYLFSPEEKVALSLGSRPYGLAGGRPYARVKDRLSQSWQEAVEDWAQRHGIELSNLWVETEASLPKWAHIYHTQDNREGVISIEPGTKPKAPEEVLTQRNLLVALQGLSTHMEGLRHPREQVKYNGTSCTVYSLDWIKGQLGLLSKVSKLLSRGIPEVLVNIEKEQL